MLLLGHTGITLGIAVLLGGAFTRKYSLPSERDGETWLPARSAKVPSSQDKPTTGKLSWITFLASKIDIRILLAASLLPDIIDKPIGHFFFRGSISNGRIIGHTLLFFVLIALAGLYLYQSQSKTSLIAVAFGTLTHLIFDRMWQAPRTLFWPLYGFAFDRIDIADWIPGMLHGLLTNPQVYLPELLGAAILSWFTIILVRRRKVLHFLKYGQVP